LVFVNVIKYLDVVFKQDDYITQMEFINDFR